mgnify:CR=1 FL=1
MAYQYENVKLEKGMYGQSGRSFLKVLESLDPSENYKGTALEGLDAFQRQLKRFDIHVKGAGSDMVEKFFHTSESSVLFPEFVSRVVRQGMESDILPDITATVTNFDGMDYRSIASVPTDDDKELKRVEEGAGIPTTSIRTQENLVKLHKRGRMLVASYEAIRFQRLDLFSVTLRQIGAYIARMHLKDAIDVLVNGDGNNNAATSYTIGDGGIGGTEGLHDLAGKVERTRGIQHIDAAALIIDGGHSHGQRNLTLDLFGIIITNGIAVRDSAHTVDGAGHIQKALCQSGFAAAAMAQQADITNGVYSVHSQKSSFRESACPPEVK